MKALVTGITGQDGYYLAAHLTAAGWDVTGLIRGQVKRLAGQVPPGVKLVSGDLLDAASLHRVVREVQPDAVFNLAGAGLGSEAWTKPDLITQISGVGVLRLLEAIRFGAPDARFVQASSAAMFGSAPPPQSELTPLHPQSPYATAKLYGHYITMNFRESYGMHASTVIMFTHESVRRTEQFVTRKITRAAARIARGEQRELVLGRLTPRRDWGWAPDFMRALPLAAAAGKPGDWVLATGEAHSVEEFCEQAFATAGLDWREHVRSDPAVFRSNDIDCLLGDPARAAADLGWKPEVRFAEIAERMTRHDLGEAASARL